MKLPLVDTDAMRKAAAELGDGEGATFLRAAADQLEADAALRGERVAPGPRMPAEDLVRAQRYAAELCTAGEHPGDDGTLLSRAVLHLSRELGRQHADASRVIAQVTDERAAAEDARDDARAVAHDVGRQLDKVLDARAFLRELKAALPGVRVSLTFSETGELEVNLCETADRGPPRFWGAALEDADYPKGAAQVAAEIAAAWEAHRAAGYPKLRAGEP